jgi:hypothetical protein
MLKKIGFSALALFAVMVLASPPRASAAVRFGLVVGGPVYRAPAPVYSYPYADPYYAAPAYDYGYVAPAPLYSYPYGYYGGGYGFRDHDRYLDRGHQYRGRDAGRYRR